MFINKMLSFQCGGVLESPLYNTTLYKAQSVLVTEESLRHHADRFLLPHLILLIYPLRLVCLEIF